MTRIRRSRRWSPPRSRRGLGKLIGLLLALLALWRWWAHENAPPPPESLAEGIYRVQRVVDGDTLLLDNGARIRLIGVNTPETVKPNSPVEPFGPEASQFTKRFIADGGGEVRLQFDRERVDRHGRFLAYVYVGDLLLNEELIRAGLARAEPQYHYSAAMKTRFQRAEADARRSRRGIWSREPATR
jgi:micrococcal nuclease